MLYKIMADLRWANGRTLPKGKFCLFKRTGAKTLKQLVKKGRIAEWSVPPLSVIFRDKEEVLLKLKQAKITHVWQLLATSKPPISQKYVQFVEELLDIHLVKEA